jgi:hypothetical protein
MAEPWDTMKTIYDAQFLRTLTNSNSPGASSINDTVGNKAAAFAIKVFNREVGVSYDSADDSHNSAIWELVIFTLQTWANKLGDSAEKRKKNVYDDLHSLSKTTARKRVTATTSSPDAPTDDTYGGRVSNPLPNFDLTRFGPITPNDPQGPGPSGYPNPFPS